MIALLVHVKMAVTVLMVWINLRVNVSPGFLGSIVKSVSILRHQQGKAGISVKFILYNDKQGYRSKIECKRVVIYSKR